MRIEILYFDGCPHFPATRDLLRAIVREERVQAEVSEIEVKDASAVQRLQFIGSPTIRINGLDIQADARNVAGVGLACRRYPNGLPSEAMIRAALKEARER
jgi:hypothetical protein